MHGNGMGSQHFWKKEERVVEVRFKMNNGPKAPSVGVFRT